ncbi:MAG: serine/threonine protein kinase [Bradymonadales bacterium]|nr:serine/threonine protein kinase [Bradymonadales bacterium]
MDEPDSKRKAAQTVPAGLVTDDLGRLVSADARTEPRPESSRRCSRCRELVPSYYQFCGTCGYHLANGAGSELAFRDPLIGVVVGDRYRLVSRIGIGGMGSVYKAEHIRMGKIVALKLLHGDLSRDESIVRRFTREARAVSKLTSRHTVSVFDYGESDGFIYLVMEYLQGQDLGQILRNHGPLSLPRTAFVLRQIATSLNEAHQHGIIHRDLKPENIFICTAPAPSEPPCVKVLDFGLAKLRVPPEESLLHTARGTLIGTPYYMSPEQISGGDADLRSDVYSLGALVFKVVTDHPPFHHENPAAVLGMHLSAPIPRASSFDPALEPVDLVLAQALSKQPDHRHSTVTHFAQEFIQAIQQPERVLPIQSLPRLDAQLLDQAELSTRKDFLQFETRLKRRRLLSNLLLIAILAGGALALWYFLFRPNLARLGWEREPNDSLAQATTVRLGQTISGTISMPAVGQRGDVDFFLIENQTGQEVIGQIEVSAVPGLDLILKTYDGDSPQPLVIVNSGGEGQPESIPNHPIPGRHLYLQIREYWIEGAPARYNLESPYRLTVQARNPLSNEEREPNETLLDAGRIRAGEEHVGMIGWAGDVDLYHAPGTREGGALIEIDLQEGGDLDLEIRLYDSALQQRLRWNRQGPSRGEQLSLFAEISSPQALYIGVAAADPEAFSTTSHYRLQVSYRPPFPIPWEPP